MARKSPRSCPLTSFAYVPVRQAQDDQHEWLDTGALGLSPDQAREKAATVDHLIPSWATMNPVVRIARVTLTEEDTARVQAEALGQAQRLGLVQQER